jgi:aspartate 1-decarboxylase
MTRTMLRSKIHRIAVTERNIAYEGSVTLDASLLAAAGALPYERVEVYDVTNGARFATYFIEGEADSGVCCINGAAAHLVDEGDLLILCTYGEFSDAEALTHSPQVVLISEGNKIETIKSFEQHGVNVGS